MNIVKALLGIGLILMSLVGFVFADENITVNETVVNDTLLYNMTTNDSVIENSTINETVINETLVENISNETSTINETDDNETATAVIISQSTDAEKYLDYVSENLENYKFWILMVLVVFAGYLACTKLL
jgi:hypothetical protein